MLARPFCYAVTGYTHRYGVTVANSMATSAERQAAFRQRHLAEGNAERLNVIVDVSAKRQLERLARHRGTTQRAVIETLLAEAERRATARMQPAAEGEYFTVTA